MSTGQNYSVMKKIVLLIFLAIYTSLLYAQQIEPAFKFSLIVEDDIGLLDSVILGYDSLAKGLIDPQFGEIDITNQPYDSLLEIRCGGGFTGYSQYQSKINIFPYYSCLNDPEPHFSYMVLTIRAKELPVTLKWDHTLFQNSCRDYSHFTRDITYLSNPNFGGDPYRFLLAWSSEFVVDRDYLNKTDYRWGRNKYLVDINNGT